MPVSDANLPLYVSLQSKRDALYNYTVRLRAAKTIDNESYLNIEIGNAELELQRVHAIMSDLNHDNPISFPTDQQFQELKTAVAALQTAISRSTAVSGLIAAGSAVIAAWPV